MYKQMAFDFGKPAKVAIAKPPSERIGSYSSHKLQLMGGKIGLLALQRKTAMENIMAGINTAWSSVMLHDLKAGNAKEVEAQIADALERFGEGHRFRPKIMEAATLFKMHMLLLEMENALAGENAGNFLEIHQSLDKRAAGRPSAASGAAQRLMKDASLSSIAEEAAKLQKDASLAGIAEEAKKLG